MNLTAEKIKERLTMREVAEHYGFETNRSGCIKCPFHVGDNTASLHIYSGNGGFCCFGCGAKGSVIDFAMRLFDCNFKMACDRLDDDFSLGIGVVGKITYRERKARQGTLLAAREHQRKILDANSTCLRLESLWATADTFRRLYFPAPGEDPLPGWVWAITNIDQLKSDLLSAEEKRWKLEQTSGNPRMGKGKLSDHGTV